MSAPRIFDNEVDIDELVPKLTSNVDWKTWKTKLFLALRAINPMYAELLTGTCPKPQYPELQDCSFEHVKSSLLANDNDEMLDDITDDIVEKSIEAIHHHNSQLKAQHQAADIHWVTANNRAFELLRSTLGSDALTMVSDFPDPHSAYIQLKFYFKYETKGPGYSKWEKLLDMPFKTGNSPIFVERFKTLLRRYAQVYLYRKLPLSREFELFKIAIAHNPQWLEFFRKVKVKDEKNFMQKVYNSFIWLDLRELRRKRAAKKKARESARPMQLAFRPRI
ncbi:uncharacterized protein N7515_010251 [Penicillium bovifimosum]|uniref:Uncharacterized protein n=1 Tax=Penicillium bovifimosum TaxID=126998 RepID=A0A9W9KV94_9EURO|nr:uncharacterized protein N7515_010251 [Penicillium bovifimosum]KAJ5120863.1 hypothetical protein N7515_010251 [Penicillium bovifimosum]